MNRSILIAATAATMLSPVQAMAQDHKGHGGMTMPMPATAKPKPKPPIAKPQPKVQPKAKAKPRPTPAPIERSAIAPLAPEVEPPMDHSRMDHPMPAEPVPAPAPDAGMPMTPPPAPMDHSRMDHGPGGMATGMTMSGMTMPGMGMGAGPFAYVDGSGTSRLPGNEGGMHGLHFSSGEWMLMAHGYLWGVVTDQGGPRGGDMAFVQSMAMLSASRPLGDTARLKVQTMLSLEPLMGARGYPNLLATGEAANGEPLIDRQHPHDLFMELSARIDMDIADKTSLFLYGGPVGEPALGPSAFMHRGSARNQPLSPITHHWFDSTHITYGVVTAGISAELFQLEASAFRGREPNERRWDIETPRLDSWSVRATWTPAPAWAVQVSHGQLKEPEELEPGRDEVRTTASVQYARGPLTTTFAFSAKNKRPGPTLTAFLAEANWDLGARHSVFGRVENVANDELFPDDTDPLHDREFRVTKGEIGYAYRLPIAGPLGLSLGGAVASYLLPDAIQSAYGRMPVSATLFAKLSLGH